MTDHPPLDRVKFERNEAHRVNSRRELTARTAYGFLILGVIARLIGGGPHPAFCPSPSGRGGRRAGPVYGREFRNPVSSPPLRMISPWASGGTGPGRRGRP